VYRILVTPLHEEAAKPRSAYEDVPDAHDRDSPTRPTRRSNKAANVSIELGGDLMGLTLCGFSIWNNGAQGLRVSFPTRPFFSADGGRGSVLIVRATDFRNRTTYERLKSEILDAYRAFAHKRDASFTATEAAS
jgi:hypothetical protein